MVRFFMSVDVAGSTFFKSSFSGSGEAGWLKHFETFFSAFPIMLTGQVGLEFLDEPTLPRLDIWKVMGDEIIFTCRPARPEEIALMLRALFGAMRRYEDEYFADLPLRLKGTAWIAAFPTPNIEIRIPELSSSDAGDGQVDYIGPDIDLGFRISKFARPSAVVVSVDLLDVLLRAANRAQVEYFLIGREKLKGVLFDRPYPIVWTRPAGEPFAFMPWEVEDCALTAAAATAKPTPAKKLAEAVEGMRSYLRKMHGIDRPRIGFPAAQQ